MNYVIRLVNRFVGSRDKENGHTDRQYYSISSIMLGFIKRKALYNVKFNIAMLFLCPSLSVSSI